MSWMWFSIFIGWLVKHAILKVAGLRIYRGVRPLFLGMILGQYMVGSAWTLLSEILQQRVYGFFP
jgi:hypothetical protein